MLKNLKVLELASVLAGPSVGQFFAELGAEVIKIENSLTNGDVTRTWKSANESTDDRSAYFCSVNWGKKSVALDLTTREGKEVVQKLALQSDIIIASYKPGDAEKLGVSYKQLSAIKPGIIYGQITGYGSDNDRVGYDAIIQAESGFMDLNGEHDSDPLKMPVALIDVLAAHQLKEGLLLALLLREKNGQGEFVEVSLIDTAISSLVNQASNYLVANKVPTRQGSLHPNIAPYGESFLTADGKRILLAIGNDRQFYDLCDVLELKGDDFKSRYHTNQKRVQFRGEIALLLKERIQKYAAIELLSKIHKRKIPAGVIQTVKEAVEHAGDSNIFMSRDGLKGIKTFVGSFSSSDQKTILPPPHYGEHTSEILARLV